MSYDEMRKLMYLEKKNKNNRKLICFFSVLHIQQLCQTDISTLKLNSYHIYVKHLI